MTSKEYRNHEKIMPQQQGNKPELESTANLN